MVRRLKTLGSEPAPASDKQQIPPQTKSLWLQLEECAITYVKKHLSFTFSLVFYDVTTLYFESFTSDTDTTDANGNVTEQGLRKPGFSKDNKFQQPQLVLGLLITPEGFPVKLQVFPGNTFEGHTFIPMIKTLQTTYSITDLTVVADAAMLSDDIVKQLESLGIGYIVGARLGNLPRTTITAISTQLNGQDNKTARVATSTKGTLICSFSKTRYNKDKHETEKHAAKAKKLLEKHDNPIKHSKFIKQEKQKEKTTWTFNEALFEKTQLLWGIKGYYTNKTTLTDQEVISHYHNLWKIEYDFRIAKTDLQIRPLYHHQKEFIKAHLLICFMALCMSKHLERLTEVSIHHLVQTLRSVTDAVLRNTVTGKVHTVGKKHTPEVKALLKKLHFAH